MASQVVALNATELGCLISLDPNESCEFVHDPSMKSGYVYMYNGKDAGVDETV